ncbi:nuclear transport factor 2 family protein [Terribacillus saccharophilus]|uniref:nuclear transport factor 2 family protein n=1 Tax=Terribacillus saccharophilus TaxID=361277 RepID=UPI002989A211|nr:nuclear transport factor 2 family protein [Terribacillus saccharophilus]MCM3226403.1 nuclear transport factor 2 family protein [Terribacillus saccharophilus]
MNETIITLSTGEQIRTEAPEHQILEHITNNQGMMNKAFIVIGDVHIATAHIVKIESIVDEIEIKRPDRFEQADLNVTPKQIEQTEEIVSPNQFELLEQELREAMQTRDIFALDTFLHDDLVFINHEGSYVTKEMDLEAHRALAVRFTKVACSDLQIKPTKDGAVTISRIHLEGQEGDEKISGDFIYTRVWQLIGEQYQVITGHCTKL